MSMYSVRGTFDWSNLDLVNFSYFKYPPSEKPILYQRNGHFYLIRKIPEKPSRIKDIYARSKAVFRYFNELAFGRDNERTNKMHIIDPDMGERLSHVFQHKHGEQAEKLIELLGSGPSHENLLRANI